jgi:hypothetical protein
MVRPGQVVAVSNVHLSSGAALGSLAAQSRAARRRSAASGQTARPCLPDRRLQFDAPTSTAARTDLRVIAPARRRRACATATARRIPIAAARPAHLVTPGAPHPLADPRNPAAASTTFSRRPQRDARVAGRRRGRRPGTDIADLPLAFDHRAVVSTFASCPAAAPRSSRRPRGSCRRSEPCCCGPGIRSDRWTALIVRRGGSPRGCAHGVADMPHDWQRTIPLATSARARRLRRTARRRGRRGAAAQRVHLRAPARGRRSRRLRCARAVGTPIRVRWRGRPANCATGSASTAPARPTSRVPRLRLHRGGFRGRGQRRADAGDRVSCRRLRAPPDARRVLCRARESG